MLHPAKAYIKYLLASKNEHGIHSPFLFDLMTKGMRTHTQISFERVKKMRSELLRDHQMVQVTDFGAGSKVMNQRERRVSDIARKAGISYKKGKLLAGFTQYFNPGNILEIGTSLGISTAFLASGAPQSRIITLEGCPIVSEIAKSKFRKFEFDNIELVNGPFEQTLASVLQDQVFDLIFIDGNHRKEPTIDYFEKCLSATNENSVLIFDDIHWTSDMEAAWEYIKNHSSVTLSIDSFKWGIVFFHLGRVRQHVTLRI